MKFIDFIDRNECKIRIVLIILAFIIPQLLLTHYAPIINEKPSILAESLVRAVLVSFCFIFAIIELKVILGILLFILTMILLSVIL